jgi:hypothetical protein
MKRRKMTLLMLPFLLTYVFQATQYARAPVKYSYYVVYAKNADISITNGTDLAPDGESLLQNSTTQQGLYNLTLGGWGPGYWINYTDAFRIINRELPEANTCVYGFRTIPMETVLAMDGFWFGME